MDIRYVKADPTGNITALVESFSAGREAAAEAVFACDKSIEQLGFLSESTDADIALHMAGGEFCGNACLSAAAYHLRRRALDRGQVSVVISGADEPVTVDMERCGENEYAGGLDMPLPLAFGEAAGMPLVRFPGICHVIAPASMGREKAEELIVPLCAELGADALGLMLFDGASSKLSPLVYVPGANTLCWEHSCASGSCAVAAWLAVSRGESQSLELHQSGGSLFITAELHCGGLSRLSLGGRVSLGESQTVKI